MVITGTRVKVIDNSGAKEVECVRLYKRSSSKVGYAGDVFLGSVKSAQPNKKIKKGDLVINVASMPANEKGMTNMMKISRA